MYSPASWARLCSISLVNLMFCWEGSRRRLSTWGKMSEARTSNSGERLGEVLRGTPGAAEGQKGRPTLQRYCVAAARGGLASDREGGSYFSGMEGYLRRTLSRRADQLQVERDLATGDVDTGRQDGGGPALAQESSLELWDSSFPIDFILLSRLD